MSGAHEKRDEESDGHLVKIILPRSRQLTLEAVTETRCKAATSANTQRSRNLLRKPLSRFAT